MALLQFTLVFGNDHFVLPVPAPVGAVFTTSHLLVTDTFGVLPSLDAPGCFGRRNCNVNLDDLRWDRPDLDCEPQQARGIPRNLQLDETVVPMCRSDTRWGCGSCWSCCGP